jgi:type I restriction enzyme M protein
MDASQIGKRAWSYAGVLQAAGLSCVEYVEQLTMLLFLKMADELTEPPYNREPIVPIELGWKSLLRLDGIALEAQYQRILDGLGTHHGMLGVIFKNARCEIRNPALLKQLVVNLIDTEKWASLPVDVKGTIWVYDLRTNMHFTLKQSPIRRMDFEEFVACYKAGRLHERVETWSGENPDGRWRSYAYDDLLKRDKLSLDLFWIKDKSLTDTDSLPSPDVLATEIADDLAAALEQFTKIAARLNPGKA